jgi:hypothetical protein
MAVKALNDTASLKGLVLTFLVFGTYPCINTGSPPLPDITQRADAMCKAMKMVRDKRAKLNVNCAINTQNGPSMHDVHNLPLDSAVVVWREKCGWKEPYKLKLIQGQDAIVDIENRPVTFRCTQTKPYN